MSIDQPPEGAPTDRGIVGRLRELSLLEGALADAESGRARLVSLSGEPGIGKTRLADEISTAAFARGFQVAWGRCWEAGGAPAYWPWTQALTALGAAGPALDRLAARTGLIAHVVTALRGRSDAAAVGREALADDARFELFGEVLEYLELVARQRPLLLVLDDIHAADRSSLLLLQFVARSMRGARIALVCCYRELEAYADPAIAEIMASVDREGARLGLGRLDRAETAALMTAVSGTPSNALVDSVYAHAQGNPLFVRELSELLRAQGWFGTDRPPQEMPIPYGVLEAIRARLRGLPAEARALLEVASVFGRRFDREAVGVIAGLDAAELGRRLRACERLGAITPSRRSTRGISQFDHILVREAVYRELTDARRAGLHAAAARYLEGVLADDVDPALAALAHHWFEAAAEVGYAPGVATAIRSAENDIARLAFEDAVSLLEHGLAVIEVGHGTGRLRAELLIALARVEMSAGRVEAARTGAMKAIDLARRLTAGDLFAAAALAYADHIQPGIVDVRLVALLDEALGHLSDDDTVLRARVLARLAAARQPCLTPDQPIAMAHEAIALAALLSDRDRLEVCDAAMGALLDFEDARRRVHINLECERLALQCGDWRRLARARTRLVIDYLEVGDVAQAWAALDRFDGQVERLGQPALLAQSHCLAAMRATLEGRFAEAERRMQAARELHGGALPLPMMWQRLGYYLTREDDDQLPAAVAALLDAVTGPVREFGMARVVASVAYARTGDLERAQELLGEADFERFLVGADRPVAIAMAELVALAGDTGRARAAYDLVLPFAGLTGCWGLAGLHCDGVMERSLALLAATLGDRDAARRHFEAALAQLRSMSARPALARTLWDFAQFCSANGDTAAACLTESRRLAVELGMAGLLQRLDAEPQAQLAPAPAVSPAMVFELRLEGEIWRLQCSEGCFQLKDSRGMRLLHELIGHPNRELHVLELTGQPAAGGDAGTLLDDQARSAYRQQLADLRERLEDAEGRADLGRAEHIQQEIGMLEAELTRAFGLGGRARRAGGAAERARTAVQRRLKDAIQRIRAHAPRLAEHLDWAITTGMLCVYRPHGGRN